MLTRDNVSAANWVVSTGEGGCVYVCVESDAVNKASLHFVTLQCYCEESESWQRGLFACWLSSTTAPR